MRLKETLEQLDQKRLKELYTVRCNITPLDDGNVQLEFAPDAYALVNKNEVDPSLIFPLSDGEDPSGRNSKYLIKLAKGANIELHVKKIVHTFKVADTRPFYIDCDKYELVYLDKIIRTDVNGDPRCNKRVHIVDIHCCGNNRYQRGFGWVGCDDGWYDIDFCCNQIP
jgi:hypothetical protein